ALNGRRENPAYLPGIVLDPAPAAFSDAAEALAGADAVIAAVPAQALGGVLGELVAAIPAGVPVVVAAKGIERGTGRRMTELVADRLPGRPAAILSGPSFADDVARGL